MADETQDPKTPEHADPEVVDERPTSAPAVDIYETDEGAVLVADLAQGNWQLWRDGKIVKPVAVVSSDEGTLYFEGPAGSYELRR